MKKVVATINFIRIAAVTFIICITVAVHAQSVAINTDGTSASSSAMLDVKSTSKGFLAPRMTSAQRTAIASPANGLLVFDVTTGSFWYFFNSWTEIKLNGGGEGFSLPYSGNYSYPGKIFSIANHDSSNGSAALYGKSGMIGAGITPGVNIAVWGDNYRGVGTLGSSVDGIGASGFSFQNHGVSGYTTNNSKAGVYGAHASDGPGVLGETGTNGKGIFGKNTGLTGVAGYFESTNSSNTATTLIAKNYGTEGVAGIFENANTANSETTLKVINNGLSTAAQFTTTNPDNFQSALKVSNLSKGYGIQAFNGDAGTQATIFSYHAGSGAAIEGISTLGNSAMFQTINASNSAPTMKLLNSGSGQSIAIGNFHPTTTTPMIQATSYSKGNGMQVFLQSDSSFGAAVYAHTNGDGHAVFGKSVKGIPGSFKIENGTNNNPSLYASTTGTGPGLMLENFHAGVVNSIATFRKNGNNMARIDGAGKGFFNGGTQVGGADMAEMFDVEDAIENYEAGDVLVISIEKDRSVIKSSQPYSTLVAGVYATKPGVLMTEEDIEADLSGKVPMGVLGVIPTKVCLEGGEIKRGDLLVTSSIPGVAMKADMDKVKPGQVIGKALENFNHSSTGKIKVLVNVK
jgi:hypothetical protein